MIWQADIEGSDVTHLVTWIGPLRYQLFCSANYSDIIENKVYAGGPDGWLPEPRSVEIRTLRSRPRHRPCGSCIRITNMIDRWSFRWPGALTLQGDDQVPGARDRELEDNGRTNGENDG